MTFEITSINPANPPAASGQGGVAASSKTSSDAFRSLFAALMAITMPGMTPEGEAGTEGIKTDGTAVSQDSAAFAASLAQLDIALADGGELEKLVEGEGENGDTLITNLLDAIKQLGAALESGEPVDEQVVANATKALDALIAITEAVETGVTTQTAEPVTPTATASTASLPQATPAEQAANTQTQSVAPQGDAQKPTQPVATGLEKAAEQLADISQRLSARFPELAAKLDQLSERLTQLQNGPGTQGTTQTADAVDESILSKLAALLNGKDNGKPITPEDVLAPRNKAETPRIQLQASRGETPAQSDPMTDPVASKRTLGEANPDVRGDKPTPTPNANASATAQAATSKADAPVAQQDPLLSVQSAQPGARSEFAAMLKPATAAYSQPTPNVNIPHVAVEMVRQFRAGGTRFEVRLNPPEMGKIDVRMDIDRSGTLNARLTVERAETLDLLQRDARALERALSQAGLDSSRTNLEFSLKQNPFARQDGYPGDQNGSGGRFEIDEADLNMLSAAEEIAAITHYRGYVTPGGVNMLA